MILVDTTFMIDALHPGSRSNRVVSNWLLAEETVSIPVLVWTELMIGYLPQSARDDLHSLFPLPEPLFAADATKAADLFVRTGKRPGTLRDHESDHEQLQALGPRFRSADEPRL